MVSNLWKNFPSVAELMDQKQLKSLMDKVSHSVVVGKVKNVLDELKQEVQHAASEGQLPSVSELAERIAKRIMQEDAPTLRPVINASGVLLGSGLGSIPLAEAALEDWMAASRDYISLGLDSGPRGSHRVSDVEALLQELTGAEAAVVVNNQVGATLLALTALAGGKDVVVARNQLGDLAPGMSWHQAARQSGVRLVEVGTLQQASLGDFQQAVHSQCGAVLKIFPSQFRIVGATQEVKLAELAALSNETKPPLVVDLGCGGLMELADFAMSGEPNAKECVAAGADVVLLSGDQLLGGPACGIVVGKRQWLEKLWQHPLFSALQPDPRTLNALAATLRLYRDPDRARREIPLLHFLATSPENLRNRAERLAPQMAVSPALASALPVSGVTYLSSAALPSQQLPTWCVSLCPADGNVGRLAAALWNGSPSVAVKVQADHLLLDLRSVFTRQDQQLVAAVLALSKKEPNEPAAN